MEIKCQYQHIRRFSTGLVVRAMGNKTYQLIRQTSIQSSLLCPTRLEILLPQPNHNQSITTLISVSERRNENGNKGGGI